MGSSSYPERLAAEFWENSGQQMGFPRDLRAASLSLPVWIETIDQLDVKDVQLWLQDHNMTTLLQRNRPLRGCLLAFLGHGAILIDGADHENEQRFTLAHEIAHFMLDYQAPRLEAIAELGSGIKEVLDGLRQPTTTERLHGILRDITIGVHFNLMERGQHGEYWSESILKAENRADQLAFALLAPAEDAREQIAQLDPNSNYDELRRSTTMLCARRYGLPAAQARAYAGWILRRMGKQPTFREQFGLQF